MPLAIKDIFDERGVPNTAGSALRLGAIAQEDATVVARLRRAGAISIGRTNLHEFAAGTTNANETFGPARNPWDRQRIPGGSSGGSAAAVSASLAAAALGTDTAGSIRIPAALCAVVGIKPTYGRVSRAGVVPLAWSLDHVGPLARTVRDGAVLLEIMAGRDTRDPTTANGAVGAYERAAGGSVRGLRFASADRYFGEDLDPALRRAIARCMRLLVTAGMRRVRTRIPLARAAGTLQFLILRPEATAVHASDLTRERARLIGSDVRARLRIGTRISAVDYLQAQRARALLTSEIDAALADADVLIVPTTAAGALRIGANSAIVAGKRQTQREILVRFTSPFNLSGHPSLALPAGFDASGMPLGIQIVGRHFAEETVVRVAHALERSLALDVTPALD